MFRGGFRRAPNGDTHHDGHGAMSDAGGPSGWDIAALVAGALALLGAIGQGAGWLLSWGDRRAQARLDRLARDEDELAENQSAFRKRITTELHEAQVKIGELERRDITRARESAALRVAFELVGG